MTSREPLVVEQPGTSTTAPPAPEPVADSVGSPAPEPVADYVGSPASEPVADYVVSPQAEPIAGQTEAAFAGDGSTDQHSDPEATAPDGTAPPAPEPVADAVVSPQAEVMAGQTEVVYDGSGSTGEGLSYSWDFDGVQQINGQRITFTFQKPGQKVVTLTTTDKYGRSDSKTTTTYVTAPSVSEPVADSVGSPASEPVADYVGSPASEPVADYVVSPQAEPIAGQTEAAFAGDGSTDQHSDPEATAPDGTAPPAPEPVADAVVSPQAEVMAGQTEVVYDGSGSTGEGLSYSWDFDGVQQINGQRITFTFQKPGQKVVTLTTTDKYGRSDSKTTTLDVAAQTTTTPRMISGTQIFSDGFSSDGLSNWDLVQRASDDRISLVSSPTGDGANVARFTVRQGDHVNGETNSRAELGWTADMASEGEELTYSWSTMFAPDYPSSPYWQDFLQWKNEGTGTPPLQMKVEGEQIFIQTGPQFNYAKLWTAPLERGKWLDFSVRVHWSQDPAKGWVEATYNGQQVLSRTPLATLYPGLRNYLKIGLYRHRDITAPGTVYHRDLRATGP